MGYGVIRIEGNAIADAGVVLTENRFVVAGNLLGVCEVALEVVAERFRRINVLRHG